MGKAALQTAAHPPPSRLAAQWCWVFAMWLVRRAPLSASRGEREGPAQREGEVGGAANWHVGLLTLPSPPVGGGEGKAASRHG